MYRYLTKGVIRFVAVLTTCSTVLLSVVPAPGQQAARVPFADWLRGQLRVDDVEAVELALDVVSNERFIEIQAFLTAVVAEIEQSGEDAGRLFGAEGLSGSHLISHLESRFSHLTPDALPARTQLTVAPASTAASDRFAAAVLLDGRTNARASHLAAVSRVASEIASDISLAAIPARPRAP